MRQGLSLRRFGVPLLLLCVLSSGTATIPADVELVSVEAAAPRGVKPAAGVLPAGFAADAQRRPLRVAFASRVNLVRFVTFHNYSLNAEARYCDADSGSENLAVTGIYWQGIPLVPGGPDPIQADKQARDDLVAYSFLLQMDDAEAVAGGICFNVTGGNAERGYRSNTVVIPQVEIEMALLR